MNPSHVGTLGEYDKDVSGYNTPQTAQAAEFNDAQGRTGGSKKRDISQTTRLGGALRRKNDLNGWYSAAGRKTGEGGGGKAGLTKAYLVL